MARKLSPWCKTAKKKLIDLDMDVKDLADALGKARPYISAVLNGRQYSGSIRKEISDYLGISDSEEESIN